MKYFMYGVAAFIFSYGLVSGAGLHFIIENEVAKAHKEESVKWIIKFTPEQLSSEEI